MTRRRFTLGSLTAAMAAAALPLAFAAPVQAVQPTVNVALIGDVPYTGSQLALLPSLVADINADADVQFTAHAGDFKGGNDSCSDANFNAILTGFQGFSRPFWYTPGDNDWTDCHRNTNGNFDPLGRLAKVRSLYFATPGQTTPVGPGLTVTKTVHTQATSLVSAEQAFAENTWFNQDCITFGDVHSVTSANGLLHPNLTSTSSGFVDPSGVAGGQALRDAEVAARAAADLVWVDAIFDAAIANNSEGVFLMMQAEPALLADQPPPANVNGNDVVSAANEFVALRAKILARAAAFAKPVILAHGDQHNYAVTPNYGGLANLTRVEGYGSSNPSPGGAVSVWLQIKAACGTSHVFSQRLRTVGQAPGAYSDFAPPPVDVPEGPLAVATGFVLAAAAGVVRLVRRARRA